MAPASREAAEKREDRLELDWRPSRRSAARWKTTTMRSTRALYCVLQPKRLSQQLVDDSLPICASLNASSICCRTAAEPLHPAKPTRSKPRDVVLRKTMRCVPGYLRPGRVLWNGGRDCCMRRRESSMREDPRPAIFGFGTVRGSSGCWIGRAGPRRWKSWPACRASGPWTPAEEMTLARSS